MTLVFTDSVKGVQGGIGGRGGGGGEASATEAAAYAYTYIGEENESVV